MYHECCQQCGCDRSTFQMVVLPDSLWLTIAQKEEFICDKCIEQRLGRPLTLEDFPTYPTMIYKSHECITRDIACNIWYFNDKGWLNKEYKL